MELPPDLRASLDGALAGVDLRAASGNVERLIEAYRSSGPGATPILSTVDDALAYAGYRMPATYAAARTALRHVASAVPGLAPRGLVDLGGGTGAAAWAAAEEFASLSTVVVIDKVGATLALGRELAARSSLRGARWQQAGVVEAELAPADLVTLSYVLGELAPAERRLVVDRAAAVAKALMVVEPGTPAGYERILAARQAMIDGGMTIVAPCPHQTACPMLPGRDWCHFAVRLNRSSVHRRLKGADLGYEDEKFSYVAAVRSGNARLTGRVLRRPHYGKGLVSLYVCTPTQGLVREVVSNRHGATYHAARDLAWGDSWPPADRRS